MWGTVRVIFHSNGGHHDLLSVAALPDNCIRFAFRQVLPPTQILDHDGDAITSGSKGILRGLHGPAGIWLHEPKLAEVCVPFGNYLRFRAGPT
jgi:hypothetical protein